MAPEALIVAESYPTSEVRGSGQEELPCVRGQGQRLRRATRRRKPGAVPEARGCGWEEQPHVQGVVAVRAQEGLEEPSHVEGQEGRWEEIPLIQGKEQQLCFAGTAVKRYPSPR